jgi:hypothetical protein
VLADAEPHVFGVDARPSDFSPAPNTDPEVRHFSHAPLGHFCVASESSRRPPKGIRKLIGRGRKRESTQS